MSVSFRPLHPADSDDLFRWINDRKLVVLSAPYRPVSRKHHADWFAQIMAASPSLRVFGIEVRSKLIGYCQLRAIDMESRNAELRIRIGENQMMGHGYGTEAVEHLLRVGFQDLGLHRICLHVLSSNARAVNTYRKCGFVFEGVKREAVLIEGKWDDVILMGILVGEYQRRRLTDEVF